MPPEITRIETMGYTREFSDVAPADSEKYPLKRTYKPGGSAEDEIFAIRIHTDVGITGEYAAGKPVPFAQIHEFADYLLGENPLDRERIWTDVRRAVRSNFVGWDLSGIGPVDIALWDFAGKYHDAPIHALLGTYRHRIAAYVSTYQGDENGGLDSPEAYADFAEQCKELGYQAFKIHGWPQERRTGGKQQELRREIATVEAVRERVGGEMDLMMDPAVEYETFADALKVGKACDENDVFWFEDPYSDAGLSQQGNRTLREKLDTPLLLGEHLRSIELKTSCMQNGATDYIRADPETDAGITGAMKVARIAEGFGIDVEIHGVGPAQRHCIAATRNANYYEMSLVHPEGPNYVEVPIYTGDYADRLEAIDDEGTVPVPEGPGLGVEYDWDYIESHRTDHTIFD